VLARVLSGTGFYGLQPVERLQQRRTRQFDSLEPATGERLPACAGRGSSCSCGGGSAGVGRAGGAQRVGRSAGGDAGAADGVAVVEPDRRPGAAFNWSVRRANRKLTCWIRGRRHRVCGGRGDRSRGGGGAGTGHRAERTARGADHTGGRGDARAAGGQRGDRVQRGGEPGDGDSGRLNCCGPTTASCRRR
jgi:hypothetical protein